MPFSVPESKRSIDQNKFEFDVPDKPGQVFKVPKVKYLPMGAMETLQGQGNVTLSDVLDLFAREEDGPEAVAIRDAVRTLDTEQLQALTEAWQKDSGVQLGESSASSSS